MWAAIRLIRAMRVFAVIFLSYMWGVAWARLWPSRCDTSTKWKKTHRRNARRMYKGFVRLRGVYIKLGQILSVMGTFLPREYTEELEALQDDVPPTSYRKIKKTFVRSFGKQLGADVILYGTLRSIEKGTGRSIESGGGKKEDVYYQFILKCVNIDTAEVLWQDEAELRKTARTGIFGRS